MASILRGSQQPAVDALKQEDGGVAVRERGRVVHCGSIAIKFAGGFLLLKLPSGRGSAIRCPVLLVTQNGGAAFFDNAAGQFTECRGGQCLWRPLDRNVVSGIARDLC